MLKRHKIHFNEWFKFLLFRTVLNLFFSLNYLFLFNYVLKMIQNTNL